MTDEQHPTPRSLSDDADEMVSAVVDGAASPDEVEAVLSDPAKRSRYEQFRSVSSMVSGSFRPSPEELRRQNVAAVLERAAAEDAMREGRRMSIPRLSDRHIADSRRVAAIAGLAAAVVALVASLAAIGFDRRSDDQFALSTRGSEAPSVRSPMSTEPTAESGANESARSGGEGGSPLQSEGGPQEAESLATGDIGPPSAPQEDAGTARVPLVRLGDFPSADELWKSLVDEYGGVPDSRGSDLPSREGAALEIRDPLTIPCLDVISARRPPGSNLPQIVALASIRNRQVVAFLWHGEATSEARDETSGAADSTALSTQDYSTSVTVVDASECKPLTSGPGK